MCVSTAVAMHAPPAEFGKEPFSAIKLTLEKYQIFHMFIHEKARLNSAVSVTYNFIFFVKSVIARSSQLQSMIECIVVGG